MDEQGGTSFATAYVSGVAALVRAAHPAISPQEVAYRLTRTADNPPDGHNAQVGYGMVNPYRAVTGLLGTRTDPPLGAMPAPAPRPDPLARQRTVAIWVAAVGALLAGVLLTLRPILVRGRRRGWRPGRREAAATDPVRPDGARPRASVHSDPWGGSRNRQDRRAARLGVDR
ncbi:S8 family serine peptidase [Micromonospora sp. NPDC050980]|uniref:S8 family serine peptidase n=1 Tax=Micromonospora sp. NPDC050980 TaxID=3155161 RepID=UPI0033D4E0E1